MDLPDVFPARSNCHRFLRAILAFPSELAERDADVPIATPRTIPLTDSATFPTGESHGITRANRVIIANTFGFLRPRGDPRFYGSSSFAVLNAKSCAVTQTAERGFMVPRKEPSSMHDDAFTTSLAPAGVTSFLVVLVGINAVVQNRALLYLNSL